MLDPQMKKGLLEGCVLAALSHGDSYGYQLIKDISPYIVLSESTLYPILRRLEGAGHLTCYSVEHSGRLRKFYRITPAGRAQLNEFIADWDELLGIYRFIKDGEPHD